MSEEAFQAAISDAVKLEKKIVEYAPYEGDISIEKGLDVEPEEFVDLSYQDLFKLYERAQKIRSTASMGILSEKAEEEKVAVSAESQEVESRLKEMTTERLKEAQELAKEPSVEVAAETAMPPPAVAEAAPEKPKEAEFEIPETPVEMEKEIGIPFKKEEAAEEAAVRPEEAPAKPAAPKAVPPMLRDTPDEAAAKRFQQIEDQILSTVGEGADELTMKKKMLELTKELFKEKSTSKREDIKAKIKVLKNMLTTERAGTGKKKVEVSTTKFDAIAAAQQEELAHTKGKMIDSYHKRIMEIKDRFYASMGEMEDAGERKKSYEAFVSAVTILVESLPEVIKKEQEYVSQKHAAELERLLASLGDKEAKTKKAVEEKKAYVTEEYGEEFSMVKHIVAREIENLIEVAGAEVFRKPEEKKGKKAEPTDVVKEINEVDEGTLLYFLHSNDPDFYKKFERKQISRAEAIFKAKELMAKEKGLSGSMIKKYFSLEGS